MKNKQSKATKSIDAGKARRLEVKQKLKGDAQYRSASRPRTNGPSQSQIDRLKKFYNTTRWLPNSAFTTYFGKPAFENYGYGNTKPVYGGLFYGNYMLSHNMNPIDGNNHPPEKQVYSSAMMKSLQRSGLRRPSPPRMVPDEIRNTPEELEEIRTRNQIFQLPNAMPSRDIIPPNLLKARYFRSGKNTPEDSVDAEELGEYEVWDVDAVLNNRQLKKKKLSGSTDSLNFNPYKQGKVDLKKKKMKEELDQDLIERKIPKKIKTKPVKPKDVATAQDEEDEYMKQKQYFECMLNDNPKVEEDNQKLDQAKKEEEVQTGEVINPKTKDDDNNISTCAICKSACFIDSKVSRLHKKENPALLTPNEINHTIICCVHHSKEQFSIQEKDPRNYKDKPPCLLEKIQPAGKLVRRSEPVSSLFS